MKKSLLLLSVLLLSVQLSAGSFYEQLCAFNFNWKKHAAHAPAGDAKIFASDKEYIQAHLGAVLPILQNASTNGLSKEQLKTRTHLIELLAAYREAGTFPQNYSHKNRVPVFIDEHGTHCAVGYLMQQSGYETMAQRISKNYQYSWLKDIQDKDLSAWQQASGLSLEELKLIQGAYDSYMHNARFLPNRYEVPQKPEVILAYFDKKGLKSFSDKGTDIWIKGEGANGVLNGKWIQNYSSTLPWIEGYYEKGKRTGLWKEYYQGTEKLCRTENWSNDKLNGIRKRYDRQGQLTEEILFKNGKAVVKTNYELSTSLKYVRKPLDSVMVYTEIFTLDGLLLAAGKESIHNPGNLQWFQNIELTALNSFSVASGKLAHKSAGVNALPSLYSMPPLVQYKKEGEWRYYREYSYATARQVKPDLYKVLYRDFGHFGPALYAEMQNYDQLKVSEAGYDSIRVDYKNNLLRSFYGYSGIKAVCLKAYFYDQPSLFSLFYDEEPHYQLRAIGEYTEEGDKTGDWLYYDETGQLYKTEHFLVPRKEDEEELVSKGH